MMMNNANGQGTPFDPNMLHQMRQIHLQNSLDQSRFPPAIFPNQPPPQGTKIFEFFEKLDF